MGAEALPEPSCFGRSGFAGRPKEIPAEGRALKFAEQALLASARHPSWNPHYLSLCRRLSPLSSSGVKSSIARQPTALPAHITVLFPFLDPSTIDESIESTLDEVVAGFSGFDFTLRAVHWFGSDVLYLEPYPAHAFTELTSHFSERFPPATLMEAAFPEVIPHLTVGDNA